MDCLLEYDVNFTPSSLSSPSSLTVTVGPGEMTHTHTHRHTQRHTDRQTERERERERER